MPSSSLIERPVAPAPEESSLLRELDQYEPKNSSAKNQAMARLIAPDGHDLPLPASMYEVLRQAAHQLAAGLAVSIVPIGTVRVNRCEAVLLEIIVS